MKIKTKIYKSGNAHVITIPKKLIESGILNNGQTIICEVQGDEQLL